jgi:hypothetical protein
MARESSDRLETGVSNAPRFPAERFSPDTPQGRVVDLDVVALVPVAETLTPRKKVPLRRRPVPAVVTLKQALNAASGRFREHLPLNSAALSWTDMAEAAWKLRPELHISQQNWAEACQLLGRTGATVCLILTDQAAQRDKDRVMKPGAYFRAMINKARIGELHLHKSIFGILKREEGA